MGGGSATDSDLTDCSMSKCLNSELRKRSMESSVVSKMMDLSSSVAEVANEIACLRITSSID
jgi:hypothetical protein